MSKPTNRKADMSQHLDKMPLYNVVLHKDEVHTPEFLMEVLTTVFVYDTTKAEKMVNTIMKNGKGIVCTTHLERAELKAEQIEEYEGGSTHASVEPV